ncbi:MAG: hypothetical protein ABI351_08965 [Herbaspirillum sp.]
MIGLRNLDLRSHQRPVMALASAVLLLCALVLRQPLEASMAWHMLVQIPMILIAGALAALAQSKIAAQCDNQDGKSGVWLQHLRRYDEQGVPSLLLLVFLLTYWMIPRSIDTAVASPFADALKFVSLFAGGMLLVDSLTRANLVIQVFFLGNVSWMMSIIGVMYQDDSTRLCNFYLVDDQIVAGQGLVVLAVLIPALWLWWRLYVRGGWRHLL